LPLGVEGAFFVHPPVGVGTKVVALSLCQVGGQPGGAIGIKVGQGAAEGQAGDAVLYRGFDGKTERLLAALYVRFESRIEQQVGQVGIALVCLADAVKEPGTDDATTAPDGGELAEFQIVAVFLAGCFQERKALSVGADLG